MSRNIARGARGLIIDSSSTETEDGASRGQGHWEPLASLVPGSRIVRFADTAHAEILCPWDVPDDAPLLLCDLAGLPEQLIGPVVLALIERFDRIVQRRRGAHVRAHATQHGGGWEGRSFVVLDEGWKFVRAAAAGHWLNEWARRARHYDCALIALTQHLQDFATEHGQALTERGSLKVRRRGTCTSRLLGTALFGVGKLGRLE